MIRRIKILSSPDSSLAIGRTKKSLRRDVLWLALALLLAAVCLVVEFVVLLREPTPDYLSLGAVGLGAVVLALLSGLLRRLRRQLLVRDQVVFDRARAVVRLNDAPFCSFDELQGVVLEAVHDTEDHFRGYLLYLTTPAKGRLLIGEGLAAPKDLAVGQAIAAFTGKPLERRGELPADAFCQP
ncbi:hypothetical protein EJV47_10495 [Hymenobacter gummosus]|uniref:Uncharacterized protein n=1 Tax=Hymenobacter gummosus TaxID=1776032 RepID=A0A3S0H5G5_9BACT|nr:hypothetical protein [Hymenobacter gummosus]RTQ50062.1 hypothetical protein EJV47_10495 [Hymenobacter gummosus]